MGSCPDASPWVRAGRRAHRGAAPAERLPAGGAIDWRAPGRRKP